MAIFWILAFAIAWALTAPTALAQLGYIETSPVPRQLGNFIGVAPAIAAFVAAAMTGSAKQLLARTFRFHAPLTSYFLAIGAPIAWVLGAYALRDYFGADLFKIDIFPELAMFAVIWLLFAFGEEIGWRGYAMPILNTRMGFWSGATLLGIVWAVWHYPKMLSGPYVESIEQAAPFLLAFTVQIVIANYFLCWLFLRSRLSVVIAALFHATFNVLSTAYANAALDLYVTACIAFFTVLVFLFERRVEVDDNL